MIALKFLLKNIKTELLILAVLALLFFANGYYTVKKDRDRVSENYTNINRENAVLNLTVDEYKKTATRDKEKLDSVLKANKLRPKQIVSATITNTIYKDTGSVKIVYRDVLKQPDGSFTIPVSFVNQCWGFKGEILSKDQASTFNLLERTAKNSSQLIVVKAKYFLFIRLKKSEYKLFTDCGEGKFTDIKFVKK